MQFEIRQASGGQYYWRLIAANGEVLATSETFYEKAAARSAAEVVKAKAGQAPINER